MDTSKITGEDFPFPAAPLRSPFDEPEPLSGSVTITLSGEALDSLNAYRQAAYESRLTKKGKVDEPEFNRLRAASDLAGWISAITNVSRR